MMAIFGWSPNASGLTRGARRCPGRGSVAVGIVGVHNRLRTAQMHETSRLSQAAHEADACPRLILVARLFVGAASRTPVK
jgi:hypothetical protein